MRYQAYKSFGYPVLSPHGGESATDADYVGHTFEPSFNILVPPDDPEIIRIEVEPYLSVASIILAVTSRKASLLLLISCRETFFSSCEPIEVTGGTVELDGNKLSGKVELSLFIRTQKDLSITSEDINSEFGYDNFDVKTGSIIAQSELWEFFVQKEFYRNPRSIITININEELQDGEFTVSLDNPYIEVSTSENLNKKLNGMITSQKSKAYAINSVYVPVITHALSVLDERKELIENKWAQILTSQLATIKKDYDVREERHNEAQALFRFPLSSIALEDL